MSDTHQGITITFTHDLGEEAYARIVDAIKLLAPVAEVTGHVVEIETLIARERARYELIQKLWEVLKL